MAQAARRAVRAHGGRRGGERDADRGRGGYQRDGGSLRTVEIYDTVTRAWSAGPPLPLAVNHAMAAAVDGTVYVFGGYLGDGTPSAAAFRLAADADRWASVADMPEARGAGGSAAVGTSIFVAGGIGPGRDVLAGSMLVYDSVADRWRSTPGPPTRREHLGGAAAGGLFYTVGGRTAAGNLATVESFDPATAAWTRRPHLPTARGGLAATGTCHGWSSPWAARARRRFRRWSSSSRGWTGGGRCPRCPTRGTGSRW